MNLPLRFANVVECEADQTAEGWIAVCKCLDDIDTIYTDNERPISFRADFQEKDWLNAVLTVKRRLMLLSHERGTVSQTDLTQADRLTGFAVNGSPSPAAVWCEKQQDEWHLKLWEDGEITTIVSQPDMLKHPDTAVVEGKRLIACEMSAETGNVVAVLDSEGKTCFTLSGRAPRFATSPGGRTYLVTELVETCNCVSLRLYEVNYPDKLTEIPFPQVNAYAFHAHMTFDSQGALYIAHESSPNWGFNERMGSHRDICLWKLCPDTKEIRACQGTANGVLPLPKDAHWDKNSHNMPPVFPKVLISDAGPVVTFRRIHFGGHRAFGWHYCMTCFDPGTQTWLSPGRIGSRVGLGDMAYTVLGNDDKFTAFLPVCEVRSTTTWDEIDGGQPFIHNSGHSRKASSFELEICEFRSGDLQPLPDVPQAYRAPYTIPPALTDICPVPPPLPGDVVGDWQLVWGDLHPHTTYSKCMGPDDGFPEDVLRFQRDVLQNQVLSLVEHMNPMGFPEYCHVYDTLENEAGNHLIPLYGMEPGSQPAHHLNMYAIDRSVFEKLRTIVFSGKHQNELFPRMIRELPERSVIIARHGHGIPRGDYGMRGAKTTDLYTSELEAGMEAMQLRGDMMWREHWNVVNMPLFPNNYLSAGAKIALLGGTDHSNAPGPNHFCLTGFWVRELTAEAVFDAIWQRRTLAVSNGRAAIFATLNGQPIGSEVTCSGSVSFQLAMSAGTSIERVCLMRDSELLGWHDINAESVSMELADPDPLPGYHWYVITAQVKSTVSRQPATIHASPFFVTVE